MSSNDVHPARRVLITAAGLVAMMTLAAVFAGGMAGPALAQDGEEEPGPLLKGRAAAEGLWQGLTGPDIGGDSGSSDGESRDGGDSGESPDDGSSSGSESEGAGGDWDSSGGGGMSEEAQQGRFGAWTGLINLLLGLLSAAGGIGVASGIALLATAHGRQDRIEVGKKVLEGSFAGFLIGTMAIPLYEIIGNVVVGF